MRKFKLLLPAILIITLYFSCRRDHELRYERMTPEQKFFNIPRNADPKIKAIAEKILQQNQRYGFINGLVTRVGYPMWDKTNFGRLGSSSNTTRTGSQSTEYVYIPFVSEKGLSTILIVGMSSADTSYRLLYPEEYSAFDFSYSDTTKTNARDVFLLFARFENLIYKHEDFRIIDSRLFGFTGRPPTTASIRFTDGTGCESCSAYQMPEYWSVCVTYSNPATCTCPPQWEQCDMCSVCVAEQCWSGWTIGGDDGSGDGWVDDGDAFEGGGGGGGGSSWWEEPCQEDANGDGRVEPCDGTVAWEPVQDNTTPYSLLGYQHLNFWDVSQQDFIKIENWRMYNIDTTNLDSCRKLMFKQIMTSNPSNVIGRILAKMDRSILDTNNIEKFQVQYKILDTTWGLTGLTHPDSIKYNAASGIFYATIFLNQKNLDSSTNIFVASTIIHETLHAYLASIVYRIRQGGVTIAQLQRMSYDSLFSEYVDTMIVRNGLVHPDSLYFTTSYAYHHDLMASKLVEKIAEAVKNYANDASISDEYYWYLAWKGLYESKTWRRYYPNFATDWPLTGGNPTLINPTSPALNDSSTNGLKYALTKARLTNIIKCHGDESKSYVGSKGKIPISLPGCYQ
jgi:hypothetical protein